VALGTTGGKQRVVHSPQASETGDLAALDVELGVIDESAGGGRVGVERVERRVQALERGYLLLNCCLARRRGTRACFARIPGPAQRPLATGSGFAPATVVKAYQLLGRTMTAAVNADMAPRSPCRAVRLPKVEREEMRFLNPAEVAWLADVIGARYRALVLLGAYGGLRIGELAGLRRRRVDLLRGRVDVAEIVVEVRGDLYMGPPKTGPVGAL
jgi:hypothetical protein